MKNVNDVAHPDPRSCLSIHQNVTEEGPVLKTMVGQHFGSLPDERRAKYKMLVDAYIELRKDFDTKGIAEDDDVSDSEDNALHWKKFKAAK